MFRETSGLGSALVVLIVAGGAAIAASPPQQPAATPLQLFQRMMPAIRHPRCNNCHGVVDPASGRNHDGGIFTDGCLGCHDEAHEWQIPGNEHLFEGRTDRQICAQVAEFVSFFGRQQFLNSHIRADDQILHAFKGRAAGARDTAVTPADRPLMTHPQFVQAADDWVKQGDAACDLSGEITVEEGVNSVETVKPAPNATIRISQTGTRTVTIKGSGSRFTATIQVDGQIITQSVTTGTTAQGQPCTTTMTMRDQYSGSTTGPASVVMKDTMFRPLAQPTAKSSYRIDVVLPDEKTTRTETTRIQDGCGVGLPSLPADIQTFDWPQWEFTLEGNLDSLGVANAVGACAKTVMWDQVGQTQPITTCNRFAHMGNAVEPWLVNHGAANSFQSGKPIPFQITTSWNLRRR